MTRNYLAVLFVAIILSACSAISELGYIAPEYSETKISNADVAVLPFISRMLDSQQLKLFFEQKNSNKEPITSKEIEFLENYLPVFLEENSFITPFSSAGKTSNLQIRLTYSKIRENSDTKMFIPSDGEIEIDGKTPSFLIIIEDAYFKKLASESGKSLGKSSYEFFILEVGLKYLIWDNLQQKTVSYGKLESERKLFGLPEKSVYMAVLESFVQDIIKNSPFAPKKVYF